MGGSRVILYIALAFAAGAIFPLLGLLVGAACVGAWWATKQRPAERLCDPQLLEEIRDYERKLKSR